MKIKSILAIVAFSATVSCILQTANAQNTSPFWSLAGNNNAVANSKLGTTNAIPLRLTTNKQTRVYVDATTGNVGIGTGDISHPTYKLWVTGGNYGIYSSTSTYGIYGSGDYGVYGWGNVQGITGYSNYLGVYGVADTYGVYGYSSTGSGINGVSGSGLGGNFYSTSGYGIRAGTRDAFYAGVFDGNIFARGYYSPSDKNLKQNIQDFGNAMSIINKLKPKNYEFRPDVKFASLNLPKGTHYGLIAQDVEQVLPNLVKETPQEIGSKRVSIIIPKLNDRKTPIAANDQKVLKDEPAKKEIMNIKAVNYEELIPILVKGLQEQDAKIQEQDAKIQEQDAKIQKQDAERDEQDAKIEALTQLVNKLLRSAPGFGSQSNIAVNTASLSSASLDQNIPNPLTNSTSIHYTIPSGSSKAKLVITDNNGSTVKQVSLNGSGKGLVNIEASTLSAGTYAYALIVDGKLIETKKMVILR